MSPWMYFWILVLAASTLSFLALVLIAGTGAIYELGDTLRELREDARASDEHPEILDQPVE